MPFGATLEGANLKCNDIKSAISSGVKVYFCGDKVVLCSWGCETGLRVELSNGASFALLEGELNKVEINEA